MTTLTITDAQIEEQKRLLVQMLRDRFPDGDWTRNSALYDHALGAIALQSLVQNAQVGEIRQIFNLDDILAIEDPDTQRQALERFARNKLLTLSGGTPARGFVDVVFSTQTEGVLPPGTRFYAANFVLEVTSREPRLFGLEDLSPVVNASNQVTGYRLRIPVTSLTPGSASNAQPQRLVSYDRFAQNIAYVEIPVALTGGREAETAQEFAERLPDAVTLRQPTTYRALRTLLREAFASIASQPLVVGYGEPEMVRDRAPFTLAEMRIHRGGSVDVYVDPPLTTLPVSGIVGSEQQDSSPLILHFRDIDLDLRDVDLRGLVEAGDVLRIYNPESSESSLYKIVRVAAYHLTITELTPFRQTRPTALHDARVYETLTLTPATSRVAVPSAESRFTLQNVGDNVYLTDGSTSLWARISAVTDLNAAGFGQTVRLDDPGNVLNQLTTAQTRMRVYRGSVVYSIGDNYPQFDNKIPSRSFGQMTRTIRVPGCVLLDTPAPARFYDVELDDPGTLPESDGTGRISFPLRRSEPPTPVSTPALAPRTYQVVNHAPLFAGSTYAAACLRVGPHDPRSGTDGTLFAAPGTLTFTSSGPAFSSDDVGTRLVVLRAVAAQNAGAYRITGILSPTTVTVEQLRRLSGTAAAVSESSLPWIVDGAHRYDGRRLLATVEALADLSAIQAYLSDDEVRPTTERIVARGYHPLYIGAGIATTAFPDTGTTQPIRYQLKRAARAPLPHAEAGRYLAQQIEQFDRTTQQLNSFDLAAILVARYADRLDNVFPIELSYVLIAPDGGLLYFKSQDRMSLDESYLVRASDAPRLLEAKRQGVSDRTVRLVSSSDLIRFQEV